MYITIYIYIYIYIVAINIITCFSSRVAKTLASENQEVPGSIWVLFF